MTPRELEPGMVRIEVIVDERSLLEVQSLLDVTTPSDAMRILISNRLATERAKRDDERQRRRPRDEEAPPEFPKRAPSEEEWKDKKEVRGERKWRKAGPVVEEPAGREEHPIRAYQRRVREEEEHKERVQRGGASVGRGPRVQGGRPGGYAGGDRPGGPPRGDRFGGPPRGDRPGGPPRGDRPSGPPRGDRFGGPPRGDRPGGPPRGDRPSGPPRGDRPGGPPRGGRPGGPPRGDRPNGPRRQGY